MPHAAGSKAEINCFAETEKRRRQDTDDQVNAVTPSLCHNLDSEFALIRVARITPNPWQPRTCFDDEQINRLAEDIQTFGLLHPIVVRREGGVSSGDNYQLVAGERRWRAYKLLGLTEINASIVDVPDEKMGVMALVENASRSDLSDYEISLWIQRAEKDFKNRAHMAKALGKSRSDFNRYFAFEKMPVFVQQDLGDRPKLLSRKSADLVRGVLAVHGDKAIDALRLIWPRVKSGEIDHSKLAGSIQAAIRRVDKETTDRVTKQLLVGKQQVGSIALDPLLLSIKIRSDALAEDQVQSIIEFVENCLAGIRMRFECSASDSLTSE